jgi:hypothetical protein
MINENAGILEDYYKRKGVVVVNNINLVEDQQFTDQKWTTEHYAEKGRKIIAKNVAEALKVFYADHFEEVKYENIYQTKFFNNCDDNEIWGQMQTITSKIAHSGDKSSETGNGNDYSITFEYTLKIIPDSLKNSINVEFWLYQNSLNHEAKLVFQAKGIDFQEYWDQFDIKNESGEINKWIKYNIRFPIPDNIKQAYLVKIYLYNPSKENVYIDDFKIDIEK